MRRSRVADSPGRPPAPKMGRSELLLFWKSGTELSTSNALHLQIVFAAVALCSRLQGVSRAQTDRAMRLVFQHMNPLYDLASPALGGPPRRLRVGDLVEYLPCSEPVRYTKMTGPPNLEERRFEVVSLGDAAGWKCYGLRELHVRIAEVRYNGLKKNLPEVADVGDPTTSEFWRAEPADAVEEAPVYTVTYERIGSAGATCYICSAQLHDTVRIMPPLPARTAVRYVAFTMKFESQGIPWGNTGYKVVWAIISEDKLRDLTGRHQPLPYRDIRSWDARWEHLMEPQEPSLARRIINETPRGARRQAMRLAMDPAGSDLLGD